MEKAGGSLIAICSQDNETVQVTKQEWGCQFKFISDEEHVLAKEFENHLELDISADSVYAKRHPLMRQHKNGCIQPGVLGITKYGKRLLQHTVQLNTETLGGATGRPSPKQVWERIQLALETGEEQIVDSSVTLQTGADVSMRSLFYALTVILSQKKPIVRLCFLSSFLTFLINHFWVRGGMLQMCGLFISLMISSFPFLYMLLFLYMRYGSITFSYIPYDLNTGKWIGFK